ncbi:hypothetical protein B0H65DRAFT_196203 [Neurospora tetraspora]|uniref:Uncharacterized protein n=1 Tax=Neurospora tetraspora TaxID=94610 RepID=A0AAE0MT03_9PEZI|nr:hypothetical protein B0H65DRAFT_196203 [Neurospora tetraspora]
MSSYTLLSVGTVISPRTILTALQLLVTCLAIYATTYARVTFEGQRLHSQDVGKGVVIFFYAFLPSCIFSTSLHTAPLLDSFDSFTSISLAEMVSSRFFRRS